MKLHIAVVSSCLAAVLSGPIALMAKSHGPGHHPTPPSTTETPPSTTPGPPVDCEAVRCQLQAAISTCASNATNHGKFVSCVSHAVKQANVPQQCHGQVVRCAARSTSGKPAFETCQTQSAGTCDTSTGTCSDGTLIAGLTSCMLASDCVVTRCNIVRAFAPNTTPTPGSDKCTLAGGTPGTGSCCAACPALPAPTATGVPTGTATAGIGGH